MAAPEFHVTDDLSVLMATAMAVGVFSSSPSCTIVTDVCTLSLGATSSDVEQAMRTLHSPDGEVTVTCTKITFTFHHPCEHSPYRPSLGSTLDDTTYTLL